MIYQFKENSRIFNRSRLDVQAVGERLRALRGSPTAIVEDARDPSSPLHPAFDWGVEASVAIEAYHKQQARLLVDSIQVVMEGGKPAPAFVSVQIDSLKTRVYMQSLDAMADRPSATQVLEEARRGLANWRYRYGSLKELQSVTEAINETLALAS